MGILIDSRCRCFIIILIENKVHLSSLICTHYIFNLVALASDIVYLENNVSGATFLQLDKNDLKEIVKQIGTVKELQNIQTDQEEKKVHMYVYTYTYAVTILDSAYRGAITLRSHLLLDHFTLIYTFYIFISFKITCLCAKNIWFSKCQFICQHFIKIFHYLFFNSGGHGPP